MKHIFVVGAAGSGKTPFAEALADALEKHVGRASVFSTGQHVRSLLADSVITARVRRGDPDCRPVDRHERIGRGAMGEEAFRHLMREPAFREVPKILETPKDDAGAWDREGLAALRRLAGGAPAVRSRPSRSSGS